MLDLAPTVDPVVLQLQGGAGTLQLSPISSPVIALATPVAEILLAAVIRGPQGAAAAAGGADKQVQYNSAGAFAASANFTYDAATNTLTLTGGPLMLAGGQVVASAPVVNASQTWNNAAVAFTGRKFNATDTASAAGSLLDDLQVNGVSKFSVRKDGTAFIGGGTLNLGSLVITALGTDRLSTPLNWGYQVDNTTTGLRLGSAGIAFGVATFNTDTFLLRDGAANTLAQRNGVNAQTFRVYDTYTDASNYSRLNIGWGGSAHQVLTANGGTGTAAVLQIGTLGSADLRLVTAGTNRWGVTSAGHFVGISDNSYDIGASGSGRPRSVYVGTSVVTPLAHVFGGGSLRLTRAADAYGWAAQANATNDLVLTTGVNGAGTTVLTIKDNTQATFAGPTKDGSYTVATLPVTTDGFRAIVTDSNVAYSAAAIGTAVAAGGANVVPVIRLGGVWVVG